MSRRSFKTSKRHVVAGWDRILQEFFLTVSKPGGMPGNVFTSLSIGGGMSIPDIEKTLKRLRIPMPPSFLADLAQDMEENAGNVIVPYPDVVTP